MMRTEDTIWCEGCGAEITWGPVVFHRRIYCCQECTRRLPCECGDRMDIDEEIRSQNTKSLVSSEYMA
jgi:hypothetical protein